MQLGSCGDMHMGGQRPSCCDTGAVIPLNNDLDSPRARRHIDLPCGAPLSRHAGRADVQPRLSAISAPVSSHALPLLLEPGALSNRVRCAFPAQAPLIYGLFLQASFQKTGRFQPQMLGGRPASWRLPAPTLGSCRGAGQRRERATGQEPLGLGACPLTSGEAMV